MNYHQRILADRYLAAPVARLFSLVFRCLGVLMRRDLSIHPLCVRHILVAKLVGMGSAIQATPLLRALCQHFPNARITFVTLRQNRLLVERMEGVGAVLCLDDGNLWRMAWSTTRALGAMMLMRADLYFDLELYSSFSSLLALGACTRIRVGFCRQSTRFKSGIYTHLVYFNTHRAIRALYLQLGRAVGTPALPDDSLGLLRVEDADIVAVDRKLVVRGNGWDTSHPHIVINPNASELMLERRWPREYVRDVIERLIAQGHRVVLIGSESERSYVAGLTAGLSVRACARIVDTTGRLT